MYPILNWKSSKVRKEKRRRKRSLKNKVKVAKMKKRMMKMRRRKSRSLLPKFSTRKSLRPQALVNLQVR